MNFNLFSGIKNFSVIFFKFFLDLIYKRKCIVCNCSITDGILCKTCSKTVQNLPSFPQGKINGFDVYSAFYYEGGIKTLIHKLKFNHNKICALFAAEYLKDYLDSIKENPLNELNLENAVIVPVVTHRKNYDSRGYDNVLEIAKQLSILTGINLNSTALKKIKFTTPQYKLSAKQRRENPKGSFSLDKNFNPKGLVILLDDIVTTGATLEYLTSLFKENGICNLICLTLSKTRGG